MATSSRYLDHAPKASSRATDSTPSPGPTPTSGPMRASSHSRSAGSVPKDSRAAVSRCRTSSGSSPSEIPTW